MQSILYAFVWITTFLGAVFIVFGDENGGYFHLALEVAQYKTITESISARGLSLIHSSDVDSTGRDLGATVEYLDYGEMGDLSYQYPYSNSLVIASGVTVSFDELTFSSSCSNTGTSSGIDYASGCSIVVPGGATLILPHNFHLNGGCIRITGGVLRGAQSMTLSNGARLELSHVGTWVDNSTASLDSNDLLRLAGLYNSSSVTLDSGSGIYISGGDSMAHREGSSHFTLDRLHILDNSSFISADNGGYTAKEPLLSAKHTYDYTSDIHHYYNNTIATRGAYTHGQSEIWFGEGGTHAGSGGVIIGVEAEVITTNHFGYNSEMSPLGRYK